MDEHFAKQAILTNEAIGKSTRGYSSSKRTRKIQGNLQEQTSNGQYNIQKASNYFRSSHKGGGANFGRLTKINMKSVEDEIEEEMSSGEDERYD